MAITAHVIADSINPNGDRLTTLEVTFPRFILAEFNTHRDFSRSSASSRAIPNATLLKRVEDDPFIPRAWAHNQRGMQAGEPLDAAETQSATGRWLTARDDAVRHAKALADLDVHKQWANRVLEPFMWHTVVVASTRWENFWAQRHPDYSPLAQPEMLETARAMKDAIDASKPLIAGTDVGNRSNWHLPYTTDMDAVALLEQFDENTAEAYPKALNCLIALSVARCARVSYGRQGEGAGRERVEDFRLFERLATAQPPHAAPMEFAARVPFYDRNPLGNYDGWQQLRHLPQWREAVRATIRPLIEEADAAAV